MDHETAQRIANVLNQAAREMDEAHPRLSRAAIADLLRRQRPTDDVSAADVRALNPDIDRRAVEIAGRLNAVKDALRSVEPMSVARALKIVSGSQPMTDRNTGRRTDIGSGPPSTVLAQHVLDWADKAGV